MEQDDEELEQLLGEIPRATSAPPHLEELQRAYGSQFEDSPFVCVREDDIAVKPFTDIRCDEHYEEFYRAYSGAKKLPPPMDNRTIYNDLPILSPKSASNQLSPFYSGLTLDSPRGSLQQQQQRQFDLQQQHKVQVQVLRSHHMAQAKQQQQQGQSQAGQLRDEHSLSAAFGSLGFDDNGSGSMHEESAGNKGGQMSDGLGGSSISNGRLTPVSNGLYSHLDQYAGYGGSAGSAMDMLTKNAALESLSNCSYSGLEEFSSGATTQQVIEKLLRRGGSSSSSSPNADSFSGGRSLGMDSYNMQQQSQILLQQQQQQQQLDEYSVAGMQPARISGAGNDMFSSQAAMQQQQLPIDYEVALLQAQQRAFLQQAQKLQVQMEEQERIRQRQIIHKHLLQQQVQEHHQSQARFIASLQSQANGGSGLASFTRGQSPVRGLRQAALQSSSLHPSLMLANHNSGLAQKQLRLNHDGVWNQHLPAASVMTAALSQMEASRAQLGSLCRYYAQGYCSRGDACPFLHSGASQVYGSVRAPQAMSGALNLKDSRLLGNAGREERLQAPVPDKILARRNGPRNGQTLAPTPVTAGARSRKADVLTNGHGNGHAYSNGFHSPATVHSGSFHPDAANSRVAVPPEQLDFEVSQLSAAHHLQQQQQQQPKYTTLEEVEGRIYSIAKDQHGCRFLQRKFDEGGPEDVQKIFLEIIDHIIELMTDPFGNYLVQKLLEVCNEVQRMEILHVVTERSELVTISLNMHGTRAVQKLIETLKSPEQVAMVIASLQPGVVTLIKDLNGNHVVQRCLQRLSNEDSQFIFDAAATHCVEIATHRHGCCVLQRCVDFASGVQRQRLVSEIAANALILSQDPFGNYVVQYILDLGTTWATVEVMVRLEGNYPYLATQKFSSNVVEKCLKLAGEENRSRIVRELMTSSRLGQLLQDPYANYVMQSALSVSKGALHAGLVEAIRLHLPALRSSPYGKRILSRTNLKK